MKVLQIIASHGVGGLEKHTIELCEELSSKGIEVHLIAPNNLCCLVGNGKVKTYNFEFSKSRYNVLQLIKIFRLIRNINPDLVHYQANKASQIGAILAKILSYPAVCTIHSIKKNLKFLKSFKSAIAVSHKVANNFPDNIEKVVIYNGIKKQESKIKTRDSRPEGPIRWISVGRLVDVKGFDTLLKAFKAVPGMLQIVGDGPKKEELIKLCNENELSERVKFLGQRIDVVELLTSADICVVSSKKEGFSYVVAEALVHKVPVISTDVPVSNEFFGKEKICATDNVPDLTKLMNRAAENNFDYSKEFEFAARNFTIGSMVDKTINHYRTIIK